VVSCDIVRRWLVGGWFVVALALFAYVVTRQPIGRIVDAFGAMGPAVVLSPLVGCAFVATRSALLAQLLAGRLSWRTLVRVRAIGDGYNALVPAAGLAGEPYKVRALGRWLPIDRAVTGLVRDRMVDNAFGLVCSAAGIAIGLPRFAVPAFARGALWTYAGLGALVGVAMLAVALTRLPGRLGALASRWTRRAGHAPEPLAAGFAMRAIGWALATRVIQTAETAVLLACISAPVSVASVLLVDGALNAAGFVGFLMPQGLGVVEGTAVYMLGALGSPAAAATAFALVRRGRVLVVGGAGVAAHLGGAVRGWLSAAPAAAGSPGASPRA
jgi:hypothetical protein